MHKKDNQYDKIFSNYEQFYNALLTCTALSNDSSDCYIEDAKGILSLICNTYKLGKTVGKIFEKTIFEDLAHITTVIDSAAVKKNQDSFDENGVSALYYLKSTIIEELHNISSSMNFGPYQDKDCFDYTYIKPYQRNMRFAKINKAASCGIVIATRQAAIMQILGIGCQRNLDMAHKRLVACAYWGDVFSAYLLAELYRIQGQTEKYEACLKVAQLCDAFLYTGCTVLPDAVKEEYGDDACRDYALISTILQDVIYANNLVRINFSFVEAITSPDLDYYQRMKYVNQYNDREWQEVTNSSFTPAKKIGFS